MLVDGSSGRLVRSADGPPSTSEAFEGHRPFFSTCATELVVNAIRAGPSASSPLAAWREPLTSRERKLLRLIAESKGSREAAELLPHKHEDSQYASRQPDAEASDSLGDRAGERCPAQSHRGSVAKDQSIGFPTSP